MPGPETITFGCRLNTFESELIRARAAEAGADDAIIFNTCAVTSEAVRQAKQSIHRGLQMSLRDGLTFEIEAYNRTVPTEDRREGVLAFNEKRKPKFEGR